jgi:hypothetical protein
MSLDWSLPCIDYKLPALAKEFNCNFWQKKSTSKWIGIIFSVGAILSVPVAITIAVAVYPLSTPIALLGCAIILGFANRINMTLAIASKNFSK